MLKYGGNGKLKQACVYRRCANPTETFQTPKTDSANPVQSQFKSESPRVKITFPATITSSPSIKTESTPIKIKTVYTAGPFNKASVTQSPPKKKKPNKYDEDPDFVIGDMEENDDDDVHETVLEEIEVRLILFNFLFFKNKFWIGIKSIHFLQKCSSFYENKDFQLLSAGTSLERFGERTLFS